MPVPKITKRQDKSIDRITKHYRDAVGPIAYYFLSSTANNDDDAPLLPANFGLVFYGLVEQVLGAYLTDNSDVLVNAMAVQGIVLAAWVYSYRNQQEKGSLLL